MSGGAAGETGWEATIKAGKGTNGSGVRRGKAGPGADRREAAAAVNRLDVSAEERATLELQLRNEVLAAVGRFDAHLEKSPVLDEGSRALDASPDMSHIAFADAEQRVVIVRVDDGPAYAMTKRLFREEGLMVGPSTGAIVQAASELADENKGLAVAISPDSGYKYTSYFADILGDEGNPEV